MVYDSEIRPQTISLNRDGMRGNKWEAHRCTVRDTIDAFAPYAASDINGGNADVLIAGTRTTSGGRMSTVPLE